METVALLEFDIKFGPTIVQSSGDIDIPKKLVNWALQSLQDDSYTNVIMEGYHVGGIKFTLRDPSTDERGGRRSFSFLVVSDKEIQWFKKTAEKILEWVHTRIDGEPRQVDRLEEILRQLIELDPIIIASPNEHKPDVIPSQTSTVPKALESTIKQVYFSSGTNHSDSSAELLNKKLSKLVAVEPINKTPRVPINYSAPSLFEEKQIPLTSFIACQWLTNSNRVKVRLQIGNRLTSDHLRILVLFSLGCENDRETLTLSFGRFFVRRINEGIVLIGQTETESPKEESTEFFDILSEVLNHFPEQVTFFLNLYRKDQSVFLSYSKNLPNNSQETEINVENEYLAGLERLIRLMDGSLTLNSIVKSLQPKYSFLDILYMIVVLNNLGMVEIRTK